MLTKTLFKKSTVEIDDDKKKCWRSFIVLKSAIDFDAYEVIFIYSFYYNSSYSSFVKFIFFNYVLIFSKSRKTDNDQFYLMISVRSIFSCSEKEKAIHNDEIKIIIADHTHAWAEIRATYDWYNRTEWIFVEYKIKKKRLIRHEFSHTKDLISYVSVVAIRY